MGLGVRRLRTPCFCNAACPASTFPFDGYFITCFAPTGPSYSTFFALYRFVVDLGSQGCEWRPVEPHATFTTERLRKKEVMAAPGFMAYEWELTLEIPPIINRWSFSFITALPETYPPLPNASNSCSKIDTVLLLSGTFEEFPCTMLAAYPDACLDADAPTKTQLKLWPGVWSG